MLTSYRLHKYKVVENEKQQLLLSAHAKMIRLL